MAVWIKRNYQLIIAIVLFVVVWYLIISTGIVQGIIFRGYTRMQASFNQDYTYGHVMWFDWTHAVIDCGVYGIDDEDFGSIRFYKEEKMVKDIFFPKFDYWFDLSTINPDVPTDSDLKAVFYPNTVFNAKPSEEFSGIEIFGVDAKNAG